jgi:hypothetical protein
MAEFSSIDPSFMTKEERAYYDEAERNISALASGYAGEVAEAVDEEDELVVAQFMGEDPGYQEKLHELMEERDLAILAVARYQRTLDEFNERRDSLADEASEVLRLRERLRGQQFSVADFAIPPADG